MKQFQQILLIKIFFLGIFNLSEAQTLDYTTENYPTTQCNVFNVSSARVVAGLKHYPVSGGVSYKGSALVLKTKGGQDLSTTLGTAYAIAISIKQGYSYNITVKASKQSYIYSSECNRLQRHNDTAKVNKTVSKPGYKYCYAFRR